jgi:ribonuclease HII
MIGGIDESGRGPVLGPLVIAGVLIPTDDPLKDIGVRDSKQCTPKRREQLAAQIQILVTRTHVIVITASDIDDLRKVMTLNEIEADAFGKIIETLHPDTCYVDAADVNEDRFGVDIARHLTYKPAIVSKHKGDSLFPVVSAASIIAKVTRDQHVRQIEQELQQKLNLPLGSGYQTDPITMEFLRQWLRKYGDFPPYVRRSWESARTLYQDYKTKKLDEF